MATDGTVQKLLAAVREWGSVLVVLGLLAFEVPFCALIIKRVACE